MTIILLNWMVCGKAKNRTTDHRSSEYRDALHHMATVYDILDVQNRERLGNILKLQPTLPAIEINKIERPCSFPLKWAAAASVLFLLLAGLKIQCTTKFINERLERYT